MPDFLRLVSRTAKLDKYRLFSNKINSVLNATDYPIDDKNLSKNRNLNGTQIEQQQTKRIKLSQSNDHNSRLDLHDDDDQRQQSIENANNNEEILSDDSESEYTHFNFHDPKSSLRENISIIKRFRRHHSIHVNGSDIPIPIQSFAELNESYKIPKWLDESGRLFDIGFLEKVGKILEACNNKSVVRALLIVIPPIFILFNIVITNTLITRNCHWTCLSMQIFYE